MTSNRSLEFNYCRYSSLIEHVGIAKMPKEKDFNIQISGKVWNLIIKYIEVLMKEQITVNLFTLKSQGLALKSWYLKIDGILTWRELFISLHPSQI